MDKEILSQHRTRH